MEGDICIVVNMQEPYFTGDKKDYKVWRHHTGYPGGLKEFSYKEVLDKRPERILEDAIKGMLPKNKLRKGLIEKYVVMYRGPFHEYSNILPQFTEPLPENINEHLGLNEIDPEHVVIKYAEGGKVPPEFEGIPLDIDPSMDEHLFAKRKTHTEDSYNFKIGEAYRRSHKEFKKLKTRQRHQQR